MRLRRPHPRYTNFGTLVQRVNIYLILGNATNVVAALPAGSGHRPSANRSLGPALSLALYARLARLRSAANRGTVAAEHLTEAVSGSRPLERAAPHIVDRLFMESDAIGRRCDHRHA